VETSKKKHSYRTFFLTSFFISLIALPTAFSVAGSDDLRFYAISNHDCKSCVRAVQLLLDLYGEKVTVYDIKEDDNAKRFDTISSIAGSEVYTAIPLVVVFQNERLVAIVFGFHSEENWAKIVKTKYNGVPIYSNLYMGGEIIPDKILTEQNVTDSIARLFIDAPLDGDIDGAKGHRDIYSLLPLIVMAAAADAVNPCEFYVLAVFLSLIFFRIGRRAVLKAGTAYATAIFAVYYLMGFGL